MTIRIAGQTVKQTLTGAGVWFRLGNYYSFAGTKIRGYCVYNSRWEDTLTKLLFVRKLTWFCLKKCQSKLAQNFLKTSNLLIRFSCCNFQQKKFGGKFNILFKMWTIHTLFLFVYDPLLTIVDFGQWCGSVGRVISSDAKGSQFESSHHQNLYWTFTVNCIEKKKQRKKRPRMAH